MLRLTPQQPYQQLTQAQTLQKGYAGAEANVLAALSCLGHATCFVSQLPDNALGDGAVSSLRAHGVDTRHVGRGSGRMGTYYIEQGAALRAGRVLYDRQGSALATAPPQTFDWPVLLSGKDYLHTTGITPALSPGCAEATRRALQTARALGVRVSFDLNFRRSLWSLAEGRAVLRPLAAQADVLFANLGSLHDVFEVGGASPTGWPELLQATRTAAEALFALHPVPLLALTVRQQLSASENGWAGLLYDGHHFYESRRYQVRIVDRIGAGDAFAAGVLHGLACGWDLALTVAFAAAASALNHTVPGDVGLFSAAEVMDVVNGDDDGSVRR